MLFSRRKLIGGAAGAYVAAICQKTASSQPLPTISRNTKLVVTGYYRIPAFLIAQSKEYSAKEGLEVEFHLVALAPVADALNGWMTMNTGAALNHLGWIDPQLSSMVSTFRLEPSSACLNITCRKCSRCIKSIHTYAIYRQRSAHS